MSFKSLCRATFALALTAPAALSQTTEAVLTTAPPEVILTPSDIDAASFDGTPLPEGQSALAVKFQVLLDRAGISPGVIDGYAGGMTTSAISGLEAQRGLPVDGMMDADVWAALGGDSMAPVTLSYQITVEDLAKVTGPTPQDYAEKAKRDLLGFATPAEALAEKFHMDVDFLQELNPGAMFEPGSTITVLDTGTDVGAEVTNIMIDRSSRRLIAMDARGIVLADYPVSVGSDGTPSPTGNHTVEAVAFDPTYSYNPDVNFQQGDNAEFLTIPPGPNGPVGAIWIDLSAPTYGIHGTPEPAKLFTHHSHGCVRMTNWDADELGRMVAQGATVTFIE